MAVGMVAIIKRATKWMEIETYSSPKLNHSGNEGGDACANKRRRILKSRQILFRKHSGTVADAGWAKEAIIVAVAAAAATQIPD